MATIRGEHTLVKDNPNNYRFASDSLSSVPLMRTARARRLRSKRRQDTGCAGGGGTAVNA
jgi:hypothetical protein